MTISRYEFYIAGKGLNGCTNVQFGEILEKLQATDFQNAITWASAISILKLRIETRYFNPIKAIESIRAYQGEGFSVLALQCPLIEFFECLQKGYHNKKEGYCLNSGDLAKSKVRIDKNGSFKKLSQQEVFVDFLVGPFFKFTETDADSFYLNVRNKLIHMPQTKGNWKIIANSTSMEILKKEAGITYLNRNAMQKAFENWFSDYTNKLAADDELKKKFMFVMSEICLE